MNEKLIELLNIYIHNNKKADITFYEAVYEILYNEMNNDKYLAKLVAIPKDCMLDEKYAEYTKGFGGIFGQAAYHKARRELVVYERNIDYAKTMETRNLLIPEIEKLAIYNLGVLQALLHEFEHVIQAKMMAEGNDVESTLLRATESTGPDTTETYHFNVKERLAQIKSLERILEISCSIGLDDTVYHYFNEIYQKELFSGYGTLGETGRINTDIDGNTYCKDGETFISPTTYYVEQSGIDLETYYSAVDLIPEDERLKYGLPMTLEEYEALKNSNNYTK